ncbi:MAG: hypothetical protein ACLQPD_35220 [Desulfomonilaceae bacterium]
MYDIHVRAEAIRAEGLQGIKLPFGSLVVAARTIKTMSFKIGARNDLRTIMKDLFIALQSAWVILGLLDPSNSDGFVVGDSNGLLVVLRKQDLSEKFLDDLWLVLRSFFEYQVIRRPDFPKICTDFINTCGYIQMLRDPPDGHC